MPRAAVAHIQKTAEYVRIMLEGLRRKGYYAEKLTERIAEEKADRVILLGDLLYHGPRNDLPKEYAPKKVIALLSALTPAPLCVRGNCEAEVDQMVLPFPVLADYCVLWADGKTVYCAHGHKDPPPLQDGDVLLCVGYKWKNLRRCYQTFRQWKMRG